MGRFASNRTVSAPQETKVQRYCPLAAQLAERAHDQFSNPIEAKQRTEDHKKPENHTEDRQSVEPSMRAHRRSHRSDFSSPNRLVRLVFYLALVQDLKVVLGCVSSACSGLRCASDHRCLFRPRLPIGGARSQRACWLSWYGIGPYPRALGETRIETVDPRPERERR